MNRLAARVEAARQRWNAGDLPGYLSLYDETVRLHGYSPAPLDKAGATAFYQEIHAALSAEDRPAPDLQIHQTVTENELYCARFTMSGVQRGPFMGIPASGRPYRLEGITIMRFAERDGEPRVTERWSQADMLGLLVQLGAVPPPG